MFTEWSAVQACPAHKTSQSMRHLLAGCWPSMQGYPTTNSTYTLLNSIVRSNKANTGLTMPNCLYPRVFRSHFRKGNDLLQRDCPGDYTQTVYSPVWYTSKPLYVDTLTVSSLVWYTAELLYVELLKSIVCSFILCSTQGEGS